MNIENYKKQIQRVTDLSDQRKLKSKVAMEKAEDQLDFRSCIFSLPPTTRKHRR